MYTGITYNINSKHFPRKPLRLYIGETEDTSAIAHLAMSLSVNQLMRIKCINIYVYSFFEVLWLLLFVLTTIMS